MPACRIRMGGRPAGAGNADAQSATVSVLAPAAAPRVRPTAGVATATGIARTAAGTVDTPAVYGYGAGVTGGAGGTTRVVSNLNNSGTGSLRDQAALGGFITFSVSGTIHLSSTMNVASNTTIAGETAPGTGITLTGWPIQVNGSSRSNIIIRNLRHRGWFGRSDTPAANTGAECFGAINSAHHLVFQNLSGAWHADETFGVYRSVTDVTVQDCIFGEGIHSGHNYPVIISEFCTRVSFFRNLMYRGEYRTPNIVWDDDGPEIAPAVMCDSANNLVWPGSVSNSYGTHANRGARANVIYNYYGNTVNAALIEDTGSVIYQTGNFSRNGRSIASGSRSTPYTIPTAAVLPFLTDATAAAEYVLANAGCRVGGLDSYDAAAIAAIQSAGL